jgi:hypothetical protein
MDDVDVGKPRLPWTAAGDGVGRATAFDGGRRAPGRGRRPWACGGDRGRGVDAGEAGSTAAWWWRRAGGVRAAGMVAACGRRGGGWQLRRRAGGGKAQRRDGACVEKQKGRRSPTLVIRITPVGWRRG